MKITIETTINSPISKVWDYWTHPEHIVNWNFASSDWHCPEAENNLEVGKGFRSVMAAKDTSMSFEFCGTYQEIIQLKSLQYILEDDRAVSVTFKEHGNETIVTETFDPENENPSEIQKAGWQAILDNFKKYVEMA